MTFGVYLKRVIEPKVRSRRCVE